ARLLAFRLKQLVDIAYVRVRDAPASHHLAPKPVPHVRQVGELRSQSLQGNVAQNLIAGGIHFAHSAAAKISLDLKAPVQDLPFPKCLSVGDRREYQVGDGLEPVRSARVLASVQQLKDLGAYLLRILLQ